MSRVPSRLRRTFVRRLFRELLAEERFCMQTGPANRGAYAFMGKVDVQVGPTNGRIRFGETVGADALRTAGIG